jgi:translation initiation factor IF-1
MPGAEPIRVDGRIVEVLSHRLVRAELSNGHQLMVHSTRATSELLVDATPGEIVVIEVSTFDLSKGRVLERKQQNDNEQ